MATYDLTPRIAPNLDRHLVFPLLEFLQERQLYPDDQILKAKIELLNKTNMVDYAMDIHKSLYHTEDVPQDMMDRRAEVVARLKSLEEGAAPIVAFLQNPNAVQELRADKQYNIQMLKDRYQSFSSPLNQVQSRIWLMYWSLFIFFNNENGRTQIIDLFNQDKVLAEKLYLNYEEAERWIVNLIQTSKLDAKIDSKSGTVIMEPNHPNVYEQLIDHTKALSGRTYKLVGQLLEHAQGQTAR
ncbi:eukaryotic translation initiation factor 3 subunit E [Tripterygium wilfordii]|uniref:Eukaryotic translation initiation factor 3 subunit E n=1 Tax=Tripterygium wilfordii TaxID=458696 RepID=A0A7J7DNT4_TRIWF|nr:eukaryotic translation initiation factor 3 subunit E [Tripterygium wilfordii]